MVPSGGKNPYCREARLHFSPNTNSVRCNARGWSEYEWFGTKIARAPGRFVCLLWVPSREAGGGGVWAGRP